MGDPVLFESERGGSKEAEMLSGEKEEKAIEERGAERD